MSEEPLGEDTANSATPSEESAPVPEAAPEIDLAAEASQAAVTEQRSEGSKIRSLDDLDLEGAVRTQIESYVSKAVNDAVSKHDERHKQRLDDEGFMNRSQIEELLVQKDAEYSRREEAKEAFLQVLGTEGIAPGSEDYGKIQSFYRTAVEDGRITPHILLSEAGIKTLVAMSGVSGASNRDAAGPRSGLTRSAPSPDGSVTWADGTTQLNAKGGGDAAETLEERVRQAVAKSIDPRS